MRLSEPRIAPLDASRWTDEQREIIAKASIGDGEPYNIFKTLVRHPKLLKRWVVFAGHVLGKSSLPPRDREIAILRIGWRCRSEYEWAQHVEIGLACGLTAAEIERIKEGPDAPGWPPRERALLRLHRDAFISDGTWAELAGAYREEQLMDLVFAVGNYTLVSMVLNTLGVQLDPGLEGYGPERARRAGVAEDARHG